MRQDMAHVIVERPRFGSSLPSRKKGYRKFVQSSFPDELPRREPMLGRWHGRQRHLNEHLGPMRRFLRSNVGRPWNHIHRELCEHVSFDNAVQKHVLAHIFDYVHEHVEIVGDQLFTRGNWRSRWPLPPGRMYVCPNSGLLKVVPQPRSRRPRAVFYDREQRMFRLRDGVWWEVRLREIPDDPVDLWDVWLERPVARLTAAEVTRTYGGKRFATSARPLSSREARDMRRQFAS